MRLNNRMGSYYCSSNNSDFYIYESSEHNLAVICEQLWKQKINNNMLMCWQEKINECNIYARIQIKDSIKIEWKFVVAAVKTVRSGAT